MQSAVLSVVGSQGYVTHRIEGEVKKRKKRLNESSCVINMERCPQEFSLNQASCNYSFILVYIQEVADSRNIFRGGNKQV